MRLNWTYSALDSGKTGEDIVARDPARPHAFCRVYRSASNSSGREWFWSASDGNTDWGHGYAKSRGAAAKAAEHAYFAGRDGYWR